MKTQSDAENLSLICLWKSWQIFKNKVHAGTYIYVFPNLDTSLGVVVVVSMVEGRGGEEDG